MPSLIQLYPNRITITPERKALTHNQIMNHWLKGKYPDYFKKQYLSNFKAVKNPFIISKSTKRKIMDSINTMYSLSKPRTIKMQTGKSIYNYRLSFVTLTLPSVQNHDDVTIKKSCLNQFFVELRKHYGVNNYVWKAELQSNQNIHFHIILDKYVDYQALRRRWNRILNKLGYVDAYQEKMQKLSLSDYHKLRNINAQCPFEKSKIAFALGKKHSWKNPNSVDVKSVYSKKELAIYLSKYIAKSSSKEDISEDVLKRQLSFGRCWFRSYSISSLKYINKFEYNDIPNFMQYFKKQNDKILRITGDYFEVFYFALEELRVDIKNFIQNFLFHNAKMYNYPFP